jgi:hypothetical protein
LQAWIRIVRDKPVAAVPLVLLFCVGWGRNLVYPTSSSATNKPCNTQRSIHLGLCLNCRAAR